jgi:hypothetical protein
MTPAGAAVPSEDPLWQNRHFASDIGIILCKKDYR